MKRDKARKWTDEELKKMEKELKKLYKQAEKEIRQKWDEFLKTESKIIKKAKANLTSAEMAGTDRDIARARKALERAKYDYTLGNRYYQGMVKDITGKLADVNQAALEMINGRMPAVYAVNYNFSAEAAAKLGISFSLVDQNTIARMIKDGDIVLPRRKLNIPKDMRWNTKKLNSAVLQGILQGEDIKQIADRITPIIDSNRASAIRNARTMVTGAESRGRMDSYHQLQDRGIVMKKVWSATHDGRARGWHLDMDGQMKDVDGYFTDGHGNKLLYPGDPSAEPETVYNCRCCLVSEIIGFRKANGRIEYI